MPELASIRPGLLSGTLGEASTAGFLKLWPEAASGGPELVTGRPELAFGRLGPTSRRPNLDPELVSGSMG